jgi:hypothetical protein
LLGISNLRYYLDRRHLLRRDFQVLSSLRAETYSTRQPHNKGWCLLYDFLDFFNGGKERDHDSVGASVESTFNHPSFGIGDTNERTYSVRRDISNTFVHCGISYISMFLVDEDPGDAGDASDGTGS